MTLLKKMPGNTLVAADDEATERLSRIKQGATVRADIVQPRNLKFHRKFFALVDVLFDAWEWPTAEYKGLPVEPSKERLRKDLTVLAGHYKATYNVRGEVRLEADSIAFGNMDEETFGKLYSDVINAAIKAMGRRRTPVTAEEIDRAVQEIVGFS